MTTFPLGINKIRSINVDTDINVISNVEAISGKREVILGDQIRQTIQLNTTPLTEKEDRQFQVFLKQTKNYGLIELPLSNLSVFKPIVSSNDVITTLGDHPVGSKIISTITSSDAILTGSYIQFNNLSGSGVTVHKKLHQVTGIEDVSGSNTFTKVIATINTFTNNNDGTATLVFNDDESSNFATNNQVSNNIFGDNKLTITEETTTADITTLTLSGPEANINNWVAGNDIFLQTTQDTRNLIISPGLSEAVPNGASVNYNDLLGQFRADSGSFNSQSGTLLSNGETTKTYRFRLTEEL